MALVLDFPASRSESIRDKANALGTDTLFRKALMAVTILNSTTEENQPDWMQYWRDRNLLTDDELTALKVFYGNSY